MNSLKLEDIISSGLLLKLLLKYKEDYAGHLERKATTQTISALKKHSANNREYSKM